MNKETTLAKWSKSRNLVIFMLIFVYPLGVYLMWRGSHFNRDLRWMISLMLLISSMVLGKYTMTEKDPSHCSHTLYSDGCTYYRDNNCEVIKQSCD